MQILLFQKGKIFQRKEINFKSVPNYINDKLKPGKRIYDQTRKNYIERKSIKKILSLVDVSGDRYNKSIHISEDSDFQIHFGNG